MIFEMPSTTKNTIKSTVMISKSGIRIAQQQHADQNGKHRRDELQPEMRHVLGADQADRLAGRR